MKTALIILSLVLASLIIVQPQTAVKAESLKTLIQPPTSGHWKNPIINETKAINRLACIINAEKTTGIQFTRDNIYKFLHNETDADFSIFPC
jgi:hypothetical protein